jgi:succinoglycan biosynthesis protein ExoM
VLQQIGEVGGAGETTVLVIDNDPAGSAMALRDELATDLVRFVHEPTPGIVAARNRALDESADADALLFIDDDELPEPGWLRSMIETWERTGAAAVAGPVFPLYEDEPEPWITSGGFFIRRRMPTDTDLTVAASGNLLLDREQVRLAGVRFDPRFAASGGSDTLFTRELHRSGARMVWCDEAAVLDLVPRSRMSRRWVLTRAMRSGNSFSRASIVLEQSRLARIRRRAALTVQGVARVVGGAGRAALGLVSGSITHRARGARTLARGVGMAAGAWGYGYAEYRRR